MSVRVITINDLKDARAEMKAIGVDPAGIALMAEKSLFRILKITGLRPAAANIIKQEILSYGGESANAYGAINCSVKATDALVFGTLKQLRLLAKKLRQHQFGLPAIGKEIESLLENRIRNRTRIMGILNVTPDSFSDGGKYLDVAEAVRKAKEMLADGADIIDVGGESTRPGAASISAAEELKRVLSVIKEICAKTKAFVSIDTTKAVVAEAAIKAGARMINDISSFRFDPKMPRVAAKNRVQVCLMHSRGNPRNMQKNPRYADLMGEIILDLTRALEIAKTAGVPRSQIVVDPGLGFGKTAEHNLEILRRLGELRALGCPILVGPSRKSFIGKTLNVEVDERLEGTAVAVVCAIMNGAEIIRVHDVKEISRVARMTDAIMGGR